MCLNNSPHLWYNNIINTFSMEDWKVITKYPNYEVSNLGNVRNSKTGQVRKWSKTTGNGFTMSFNGGTQKGGGNLTKSSLMREYWKYEFIKDLDDDEECKELTLSPNYFITTKGRIFSLYEYNWMKTFNRRTSSSNRGYYDGDYNQSVNLRINGKSSSRNISRLVGMTFLPDFNPSLEVLHIDENLPDDKVNCLNNLKMGTHQENCQERFKKGRCM